MVCEMYKYEISSYYWEYNRIKYNKYFYDIIEAPDSTAAVQWV